MLTPLLLAAFASAVEPEPPRTLDVSGVGEVWVEPDEAVLMLGVQAEERTADAAFDAASERMQGIVAAVTVLVPQDRVRTTQLSLQPRYDYPARGRPQLVGYVASSSLEIRVDDPANTGAVLDAAVAAGANDVAGVTFQIQDEEAAREAALDAAVEDARANAEQVATGLGVTLGTPTSVTIRDMQGGPQPLVMERAAADEDAGVAMPVLSGEQIYRAQVDVKFEILGAGSPISRDPDEEDAPS